MPGKILHNSRTRRASVLPRTLMNMKINFPRTSAILSRKAGKPLFYPTNQQIMDVDIPRTANILSTLVVVVSNYGFRIVPLFFAFRVIDRGDGGAAVVVDGIGGLDYTYI